MKTFRLVYLLALCGLSVFAQTEIKTISPARNQLRVPITSEVKVSLNKRINNFVYDEKKLFSLQGTNSGLIAGLTKIDTVNNEIKFTPASEFFPGEIIYAGFGPLISKNGDTTKAIHWQFTSEVPHKTDAKFDIIEKVNINTSGGSFFMDINHDGRLDIITTEGAVFFINGKNNFTQNKLLDISGNMIKNIFLVADLNRDGHLDLVCRDYNKLNTAYIYLGLNETTFSLSQTITSVNPYLSPYCTGDINGDNFDDLIIGEQAPNYNDSQLKVYINDGRGFFNNSYQLMTLNEPFYSSSLSDTNNDLQNELIVRSRNYLFILNSKENVIYSKIATNKIETGNKSGFFIQDYDGNGLLDVSIQKLFCYTYYNEFGTSFTDSSYTIWGITDTGAPNTGDFNGDGLYDFVVGNRTVALEEGEMAPMHMYISFNHGKKFTIYSDTTFALLKNYQASGGPLVGDIDGDGDVDIINCGIPTYIAFNSNKVTSITKEKNLPIDFQVYQNYPNPFNPITIIKYEIPNAGVVNISVYNILGEKVKEVFNGYQSIGTKEVELSMNSFSSGVYICKITFNNSFKTVKLNFIK